MWTAWQVGSIHPKIDETTLRVYDNRENFIKHVPRTSRKEVTRHKAYGHTTNHKIG